MKIAISSVGKNLTEKVSEIFARYPCFITIEIKNQKIYKIEIVENKMADQMSSVGIFAAQLIAEKMLRW